MITGPSKTCTWIGADQDPQKAPITYCGHTSMLGKSYCAEHYPRVYKTGTSVNRKKANAQALEQELAKLMADQAKEMEDE